MGSLSLYQNNNLRPKAGFFAYASMIGIGLIVFLPYLILSVLHDLGGIAAPLIFRNTNFSHWRTEGRWAVFILVGAVVAAVILAPSYVAVTLFDMLVEFAVRNATYVGLVERFL